MPACTLLFRVWIGVRSGVDSRMNILRYNATLIPHACNISVLVHMFLNACDAIRQLVVYTIRVQMYYRCMELLMFAGVCVCVFV